MKYKVLIFYAVTKKYKLIGNNDDWHDALKNHKSLNIKSVNLHDKKWFYILPFINNYDLIVFLHSTNSNNIFVKNPLIKKLLKRKAKIIFFVGNEYKLMPEKISLLDTIKADYIASQVPQDIAEWLYEECKDNSKILSIPHALNPEVFKPEIQYQDRKIDIGVRAYKYPMYLGDEKRKQIIEYFKDNTRFKKLKIDISFNIEDRFTRKKWAFFLNSCKATVSTEGGSSYLERNDNTRIKVNKFLNENPNATFEDVYNNFFLNYKNPVSGKCVTPRNFEAIGTKTCQIMFPGRFNDILKANEHYIALNEDFSNIEDVMERFNDKSYVKKMIDNTYDYILDAHTYNHRIDNLLKAII